ncbi:MAG: phage tail protein I [Aeromonas sobria]|uniref:phage tail protein I n=1 Tax=Aeromonas sobria TaxID=646 RepID=UPI003F3738A8
MSKMNPEWAKAPLLPFQSSDLEKDLDIALSHIESVSIPIRDLWNPEKCPIEALPYLAWAVKVGSWSSRWTERVKRQVVAASLDLHRVRGTRPAIEKALQSLDVRCEIVEWFEQPDLNMEPGTFRVTAHVSTRGDDGTSNADFTEEIRDVIDSAKPASRPYTLAVQGMLKAQFGPAIALRIVKAQRFIMETR